MARAKAKAEAEAQVMEAAAAAKAAAQDAEAILRAEVAELRASIDKLEGGKAGRPSSPHAVTRTHRLASAIALAYILARTRIPVPISGLSSHPPACSH